MANFRVGPAGFDLSGPVDPADQLGAVHFLGIAGIGMSAIAWVMLGRGMTVSGSDAKDLPVLHSLAAAGATVGVGFDPDRLAGVDTVVASSAVRADNPELATARATGLRVLHRSQALASVMVGKRGAAVAGTSGKTTTTSMLVELLRHAGADPSFAVGGELVGAGTNGADGSGDIFVIEADESDASFLVYQPAVSVVTNVAPDHLDHYGTGEAVAAAFSAFVDRLGPTGTLVASVDDPGSVHLVEARRAVGLPTIGFGRGEAADVRIVDEQVATDGSGGTRFRLVGQAASAGAGGHTQVTVNLPVPGAHNVLNAAAAYAAAIALGTDPEAAAAGLGAFAGARRRFEFRGDLPGTGTGSAIRIFDDYAHNPPKVAAAVATARQVAGDGRVIAIFQPHLYSRTRDFATEFGQALGGADVVAVMDVYGAREDPMPGVSGRLVLDAVPYGRERHDVPGPDDVVAVIGAIARPGDVIVTIGAGDITYLAPRLVQSIRGAQPAGTEDPR